MRRRTLAWLVVCLTIVGTMATQMNFGDSHMRVHQHRMAKGEQESGALAGMGQAQDRARPFGTVTTDVRELATYLPLVEIETQEAIPGGVNRDRKESEGIYTTASDGNNHVIANMKIYDSAGQVHRLQDIPDVKTQIQIRVRGNSSRYFDKPSWSVKTIHSNGENKDLSIMGMEANHDWALHGPFLDKTLMRNYMGMNISGELMDYAPDVRFCEVVLNGRYEGVYVMMETVSRGHGRIGIEKPNHMRGVSGYIIELDNSPVRTPDTIMDNLTRYTGILHKNSFFDIRYPGGEDLTQEIREYIESDVSRFEKALYSFDYDTLSCGYRNYIDVEEFADYFILAEVFMQRDTGNHSTYFYKGVNGKYKPCVWDFNNDLDNDLVRVEDDYFSVVNFVTVGAPWFEMLIRDEGFTDMIIRRYRTLRGGVLSDEYLTKYMEETADYLREPAGRNYMVWGYSFDPSRLDDDNKQRPDARVPGSWEEALAQMEGELLRRLAWLDQNIEVLRQYSHESAVKRYNH